MPNAALATFSSASQFSFADSFRSPRQYFSSSFHIHPDFISRAMISPRTVSSLPRFPSRHYFLAIASSVVLFSSLFGPCSVFARCNARPISRYPLTCRQFFTRDTFHPTTRAPFLLSEGHWNRIKLYAGFSMPPFPPVAMKGGIRHGGRSSRRKMGRSRLNEVERNFLGLLSNVVRCGATTEKRWGFAIGLIGSGKVGERTKKSDFAEEKSGVQLQVTVVFPVRVYPGR